MTTLDCGDPHGRTDCYTPHLTLLTTDRAGEILGLTRRALEERRRRGDGPPYIRVGGTTVRYRLSDLEDWLVERTYTSTAEEGSAAER